MKESMTRSEAGKLGGIKSSQITEKKFQERKNLYKKNPTLCTFCESKIPYSKRHNKFCNRSCFASFSNLGLCRNSTKREHQEKSCKICGKKTTNLKFCSKECFNENRKNKIDEQIISGKYKIAQSGNPTLYNFLIRHRGHRCEKCLNNEWNNQKIPLTVHHIDGNASNNVPSNLQLLCWNCHALTPNYGSKNQNSARNYRYKK